MATAIIWDNFSERTTSRNLGIKVEEKIFYVSRDRLAELSPVFKTMLASDGKRKNTMEVKVAKVDDEIISLEGKKPDAILELLRCLFESESQLKAVDENNMELLVKLANEYEISALIDRCSKYLCECCFKANCKIEKRMEFFATGVRLKMKYFVRKVFQRGAGFDFRIIKPYLEGLPTEIKAALFIPFVSRTAKHEMITVGKKEKEAGDKSSDDEDKCGYCSDEEDRKVAYSCKFCDHRICNVCFGDSKHDQVRCGYCHVCRRNLDGDYDNISFQCLTPLIITELEKIGL